MPTVNKVWNGAEELRRLLVPVDKLRTHPDNPKRGDIGEIAASLNRFGQVRAILADTTGTVVAGNHTYLAAVQNGWTHVAAILHDFASPEEARAYLLADNRFGDLGEYDRAELTLFLEELAKTGVWAGTGYQESDLDHLRKLSETQQKPGEPPVAPTASADPPPALREVVLLLSDEQSEQFAGWVRELRTRYGIEGITETVLRALHEDAADLNQKEKVS